MDIKKEIKEFLKSKGIKLSSIQVSKNPTVVKLSIKRFCPKELLDEIPLEIKDSCFMLEISAVK